MNRAEYAVVFDGSFDGFLSVVYAYYYDRVQPVSIQREGLVQQSLTALTLSVATEAKKAERVLAAIRQKATLEAAWRLYMASLADGADPYMDMFAYALMCFRHGAAVDDFQKIDAVLRVRSLSQAVAREAHKLTGFCRFAETRGGTHYAPISPKHDALPLLAEHFSGRLGNQAWLIHDTKRQRAAVYDGRDYIITDVPAHAHAESTEGEAAWQDLWRVFYGAIGIETRTNPKLQRQLVPLYFRSNMTEFQRAMAVSGNNPLT